ncbi:MAG: hypothetical protein FD169_2083 [Bacillota bacterium]|nr:MAG: hypothetical protein FD169_2083 [Bacillota bacterium]
MSRIALVACSSRKQDYACPASELYSASARFGLAYEYAKKVADPVYILSAKHGLVADDAVLSPYNESLLDKGTGERRQWAEGVVAELQKVTDLAADEFVILAGAKYCEYLLPHLKSYQLPLKGKRQGEWIPELKRLLVNNSETLSATNIHRLFNGMPRLRWDQIGAIPYDNGIYVMFEQGETYGGMDRIVRVGTHTADDNLRQRLHTHYVSGRLESSIFRKNIARALLGIENPTSTPDIETKVSDYLRQNVTFVCFPVPTKEERLRFEEGLIASLHATTDFRPSDHWLGLKNPMQDIRASGLWNRHGLNGCSLTGVEFIRLSQLVRGEPRDIGYEVVEKGKRSVERAYSQYTLHEAMRLVLDEQPENTMHAADLAELVYARKLYVQRDGGMARPNQIRARSGHYGDLFEVLPGNFIKLRGERAAL